jgi:outer membrane protein assembly factor BamB
MAKVKYVLALPVLFAPLTVLTILFVRAYNRPALLAMRDDAPPPELRVDCWKNLVVRHDEQGVVKWSITLEGPLGRARPPHSQHDEARAYLTHDDGVTALDWNTGQVVWHSPGPAGGLCLSGDLLLATGAEKSGGDDSTPCLTARNTTTGAETFRVPLPLGTLSYRVLPVEETGDLFVVQPMETIWDERGGVLIDRRGQVRFPFDRHIIAAVQQGEEYVFVTLPDVVRVSPDGNVRWLVPFEEPIHFESGEPLHFETGGITRLAGGQLLVYRYGTTMDSGVQVIRLDPTDGRAVWTTWCAPLGVGHSEYDHTAKVEIKGDQVRVKSRGDGGRFVEVLDLNTGKRMDRAESEKHGF